MNREYKLLNESANRQKGAVMILFALLLVTLFSFLALVIDTTLFSSSQSHLAISADAAVLGALQEYGNKLSITTNTPADALTAAVNSAKASLALNFNNNPGKFLQKQSANTQDIIGTDCTPGAFANGCLMPIT